MGGRSSSFRAKKSGGMTKQKKQSAGDIREKEKLKNQTRSWVEIGAGDTMPTTTTYERFEKRNARYWDQKWREHVAEEERIEAAKSPAQKRQEKNLSLESVARHREKINKIKRRINARGGALDLNGKRTQVPMMPMPELRHLSREEINKVKKNIRRKKE
jgi:hypothetical protein